MMAEFVGKGLVAEADIQCIRAVCRLPSHHDYLPFEYDVLRADGRMSQRGKLRDLFVVDY